MTSAIRFPRLRLLTLLLAAATLTACATGGSGDDDAPRGSRNHIIRAELESLDQLNAYQAVERLRPNWLRSRVGRTPAAIVDGNPSSSLGVLRSIRATDVEEMRFLSASDATTRYGTGYDGGAIAVNMLRGG